MERREFIQKVLTAIFILPFAGWLRPSFRPAPSVYPQQPRIIGFYTYETVGAAIGHTDVLTRANFLWD